MIGRFSFMQGDPARIDDGVAYVRDLVRPTVDALPGSLGLAMWVNRQSGDGVVLSSWRDAESLEASEAAVSTQRDHAAALVGGLVVVERYVPLLIDIAQPAQPGFTMRMLRTRMNPALADANVAWTRDEVIPAMKALSGYTGYTVAFDNASGTGLVMSTWETRADAEAAAAAAAGIRQSAAERKIEITGINLYELVVMGLRGPGGPLPGQRAAGSEAKSSA